MQHMPENEEGLPLFVCAGQQPVQHEVNPKVIKMAFTLGYHRQPTYDDQYVLAGCHGLDRGQCS